MKFETLIKDRKDAKADATLLAAIAVIKELRDALMVEDIEIRALNRDIADLYLATVNTPQ